MNGPRFGPAGRAASFEGQGYKKMSQVVEYLRNMSPVWKDLVAGKKPFML